ncbi:MAG: helix-turn-helix domain-containing protein [Clostridia bacterium]|nr:helix-turn-helix domain-containing protein [Clostridia bacterium]
MITSSEIQTKIAQAIEDSGLELNQIAKEIGVSAKTLLRYVKGERLPRLDTFGKLCKLLNLDAGEILCLR